MIYRCKGSFAFGSPPRVYAAGLLIDGDDPILKTHGMFFEPVEAEVSRRGSLATSVSATETADATPGAARQTPARRPLTKGDVK